MLYLLIALILTASPAQGFTSYLTTSTEYGRNTGRLFVSTQRGAETSVPGVATTIPAEDDRSSARAGKDGYSVMRQPLCRENWNPTVDPNFDAPLHLDESDGPQQNALWWSQKQHGSTNNKLTSRITESSSNDNNGNKSDAEGDQLDLFQRSVDTLDFPFVLKALRELCFTSPARKLVQDATNHIVNHSNKSSERKQSKNRIGWDQPLVAETMEGANQRYAAVRELGWLLSPSHELELASDNHEPYWKNRKGYKVTLGGGSPPPLEGLSFDLDSIFDMVDQGQILEGPEILEVSTMMDAMEDIQLWSEGLQYITTVDIVELPRIVSDIQINSTLQVLLADSFDEDGKLCGRTFPQIGRLRAKVRSLKTDILQTLDTLVTMPSIQNKLALESGGPLYSEIGNGGRLVLPIDPKHASSIGIVHDSSRSGKTVFVEPSEIVGPTNDLRQSEGELRAEEARVWRSLTEQLLINRRELEQSTRAVGQLDLALARCLLGQKLDNAIIPVVKDEGVISLGSAKHPVLLVRNVDNVVGSDVEIGSDGNQGLVLTGPNAGGKTVILKLLGLTALMARSGIPVPASTKNVNGDKVVPRVDFFDPVLADIGDLQTVGGDLSTFSGHMLVCREVLKNSGKSALALLDELGSGTDPNQGVAIAQSVLEALVDSGCRVAITTHYLQLKQLAASDSRFAVGGMQFVKGQPTYKLLQGTVGESFAMAVAERLKLPQRVIDRSYELLDSETRQMGDLLRGLEDQKAKVDEQVAELEDKKREIAELEVKMKEEKIKLERKMLDARRVEAKKFAKKLEEKEQILENVLERLKSDPSRKILAKSWDDIKFVKRDALTEAENVPSVVKAKAKAAQAEEAVRAELVPVAELREKTDLKPGDTLVVCKAGPLFGREAIVEKVLGRNIEATVSGMKMAFKLTEVAMMTSNIVTPSTVQAAKGRQKSRRSKAAERALLAEGREDGKGQEQQSPTAGGKVIMRTESNTVDVRGCNLEEAKERARTKFSQSIMMGRPVVFILHGHGTGGVLKTKIRGWLRTERQLVKQWNPADMSDGGDAFTRVELR